MTSIPDTPLSDPSSNSTSQSVSGGVANATYTPISRNPNGYATFDAFYPYYLGEHANSICRRLHLVGTSISSLVLLRVLVSFIPKVVAGSNSKSDSAHIEKLRLQAPLWKYLAGGMLQAYFMAWVGHFFFEHNKPATFKYPIYSLLGDLKMLSEVVTGKRRA